jgi:hypothetical protein
MIDEKLNDIEYNISLAKFQQNKKQLSELNEEKAKLKSICDLKFEIESKNYTDYFDKFIKENNETFINTIKTNFNKQAYIINAINLYKTNLHNIYNNQEDNFFYYKYNIIKKETLQLNKKTTFSIKFESNVFKCPLYDNLFGERIYDYDVSKVLFVIVLDDSGKNYNITYAYKKIKNNLDSNNISFNDNVLRNNILLLFILLTVREDIKQNKDLMDEYNININDIYSIIDKHYITVKTTNNELVPHSFEYDENIKTIFASKMSEINNLMQDIFPPSIFDKFVNDNNVII